MTDTPDMFECRLVGYSKQSRKDGDWVEVRFHIHPDDVTPALAQAPLKTTFMVAATPAEKAPAKQPMDNPNSLYKPKRSWDEMPLSEQAGIRSQDPAFQEWLVAKRYDTWSNADLPQLTLLSIRHECGIESRSQLSPNNEAGRKWLALDEEYRQSQGLIAEQH